MLGPAEVQPVSCILCWIQVAVITGIAEGRDVFAILPTGYGKSLCFGCLPLVFDYVHQLTSSSIVVVVTPLTAIITDQVTCT